MKRIISVCIVCVMVLAMVGCKKEDIEKNKSAKYKEDTAVQVTPMEKKSAEKRYDAFLHQEALAESRQGEDQPSKSILDIKSEATGEIQYVFYDVTEDGDEELIIKYLTDVESSSQNIMIVQEKGGRYVCLTEKTGSIGLLKNGRFIQYYPDVHILSADEELIFSVNNEGNFVNQKEFRVEFDPNDGTPLKWFVGEKQYAESEYLEQYNEAVGTGETVNEWNTIE